MNNKISLPINNPGSYSTGSDFYDDGSTLDERGDGDEGGGRNDAPIIYSEEKDNMK